MKGGDLFKTFADEDLNEVRVKLKIGGGVEITFEEAVQLVKNADALCSMRFRIGLASVDSKGRGVVEMTLRKDTFDLNGVEMPPPEEAEATEPMLGPNGEILTAGDAVDAALEGIDGPAPGEGFDALEGKRKRGRKAKAKLDDETQSWATTPHSSTRAADRTICIHCGQQDDSAIHDGFVPATIELASEQSCPWPACTLPAEHPGDHEFPVEDPSE